MVECVLAVIESVRDALAEMSRDFLLNVARHVLAYDVAAEWKWQTCFLEPPRTHVGDEVESLFLVGELTFVDQESGIDIAANDSLVDLIERNNDRDEIGLEQLEGEVGARHHAGDSDAFSCDLFAGHRLLCHEHRAIAVAH